MNSKSIFKMLVVRINILVFVLLLSVFLIFLKICDKKSNTFVTYKQNINSIITDYTPLYVDFSIPEAKTWEEADHSIGAQYDGKFINNTNHDFTDWTITVNVPSKYRIDSYWNFNGEFYYTAEKPISIENKSIQGYENQFSDDSDYIVMKKIANNGATTVVSKNTSDAEPFMVGMIMYTPTRFSIRTISITGRFIYSPKESPVFYLLICAMGINLIIFLIVVIVQISVHRKVRYYELRQKLDSDIIVQSFKTFAKFVDAKDSYTRGHSLRVGYYAKEIARRLKMSEQQQNEMFWYGLMHDVGKIGISDNVLKKPSSLESQELEEIRSHVLKGYEMLSDFTAMPMLKEVAKSHHEHWDGTGYCEHLKGEEIPFEARIVCVCDSYDAMNTTRCYRESLTREQIIAEFKKNSGTFFDPQIAKIMIEMLQDNSIDDIKITDSVDEI